MALRLLLTILIILPLVSCKDEATDVIKELKIIPIPNTTILGLWREGPMELEANLATTITLERIENESIVKTLKICNLNELEDSYDFTDMEKSYLFHFFINNKLTIHITIHTPDGIECVADTMGEIEYQLTEHNNLHIDGQFIGPVSHPNNDEMILMIDSI